MNVLPSAYTAQFTTTITMSSSVRDKPRQTDSKTIFSNDSRFALVVPDGLLS